MNKGADRTVLEEIKELRGWLVALNGPLQGKAYRLFAGKTFVGSCPYADLHLPDSPLESCHFSIRLAAGSAWLSDLDSNSGVFIDGRRIWKEKIIDETQFTVAGIDFLIKML
ncbi:MAG: FHA domain-containing protein [Candidatus Omnitrophota bacterium]